MVVVIRKFRFLGVALVVVLAGLIGCADLGLVGDQGDVGAKRSCTSDSNCVFDGISNRALGAAKLSLNGDGNLVIDNIGSTGLDGVRQYAIPTDTVLMTTGLACPNFVESVEGSKAVIVMYGDVPGEVISTMEIENVDGQVLQERSDMSYLGVSEYRVTILRDGEVVATVDNISEPVVSLMGDEVSAGNNTTTSQVLERPTDITEVLCGIHPWGTWHIFVLTYDQNISVNSENGTGGTDRPVIGDEVHVLGLNQTVVPHVQSAFDNFFTNMGPVEMTFQTINSEILEEEPTDLP